MCQIWPVTKKGKKDEILFYAGICNPSIVRSLPKNSSYKAIKKLKSYKKKIVYLFGVYPNQYKSFEGLLGGVVDMVGSLEYHYANHAKVERRIIEFDKPYFDFVLSDPDYEDPDYTKKLLSLMKFENRNEKGKMYIIASYEATAYLNRLGQIKALFDSDWFRYVVSVDINQKIPTIAKIEAIRHKVTAHRRQDDPRKNDIGFLSFGMNAFRLEPLLMANLKTKHVGFRYALLKENHIEFIPSVDHPKIVNEIFDLIELFLVNVNTYK